MDQSHIDRIVAEVIAALRATGSAEPAAPEKAATPSTAPKPSAPVPARSDGVSQEPPESSEAPPKLVTEEIVLAARAAGRTTIRIAQGAIVTPLARDALRQHGIALASALPGRGGGPSGSSGVGNGSRPADRTRVAIGTTAGGRAMASQVMAVLRKRSLIPYQVPSMPGDAAHVAARVAGAVSAGTAAWGIVVEETGIVAAAAASKAFGVRAAACCDPFTARVARERMDANVLCLGADVVAAAMATEVVEMWLNSSAADAGEAKAAFEELDRGAGDRR